MIPGEHELLPVKKNHMSARMAWRWDGKEVIIDLQGLLTAKDPFHANSVRAIIGMHDSLTAKFLAKQLVICNVVFMS